VLEPFRLYLHYISQSVRSQMQYRASFFMLTFGLFLLSLLEFCGILILFDRFGQLRGWSLPEIALFYGMIHMAFSLAEGTARGFDTFSGMVKGGDFDRLLLRPRSTVLQLAGQELQLRRVGRFLQALGVLLWGTTQLELDWTVAKTLLLCFTVLGGTCVFYGLFVLQATMCFWTTEGLEIANTVTNGGTETAQYPLSIYRDWFRSFFTFVVPLACVSYYPALAMLDRSDPLGTTALFHWLAPCIGFVFLAMSLLVWGLGVRHYRSTGS
jgi:ABC-2 type transport system permease protein